MKTSANDNDSRRFAVTDGSRKLSEKISLAIATSQKPYTGWFLGLAVFVLKIIQFELCFAGQ
jgi:hypothetical protein